MSPPLSFNRFNPRARAEYDKSDGDRCRGESQ
jgi:hypothetical protein